MDSRSTIILEFLAERHPNLNLSVRKLFSNRKGVRTLDEAVERVQREVGVSSEAVFGFTRAQWEWVGSIPNWSLGRFLREGDARLIVPVAHLADFWFYELDCDVTSGMRSITLDMLGQTLQLEPLLEQLHVKLGESYGDDTVKEYLCTAPEHDNLRDFAVASRKHGARVARLVADGMPLEYAQAVATD